MPGERIGNSNQYLTISGVVSAPAYSWASDNDTGLYRIGANNIGVAANGTKVLDISNTAVTITPATTLSAALTYGGVTLSNSVTGTGSMVLSAAPAFTGAATGVSFALSSFSQATSFRLDANPANHGFLSYLAGSSKAGFQAGNSNTGAGATNGAFFGVDTTGNATIDYGASFPLLFKYAGTEKMRLDTSGNLGIGGTPANQVLNVFATSTSTTSTSPCGIRIYDNGFSNSVQVCGRNGQLQLNAGSHVFLEADAEVARFDSSGRLLLNTTSTISIDRNECAFPGSTTNGFGFNDTTASAGCNILVFRSNGNSIGTISNSSNTGVLYNVTSDKELKNFVGVHNNGDILDRIEWNDFTWKSHPENGVKVGAFAQDIYEIIADIVTPGKGTRGEEDFIPWQVDYTGLVPYLGAEVKSLRARVATLEARLTALENK